MKRLFILSSLVLMSSPVFASNHGVVTSSGTVAATCSVGDLSINLLPDGGDKLFGTGEIDISQTGTTRWDITTTGVISEETPIEPIMVVLGPNSLTLSSSPTQTSGSQTITGSFTDKADVSLTISSVTGRTLAPGTYETETTLLCTVQ